MKSVLSCMLYTKNKIWLTMRYFFCFFEDKMWILIYLVRNNIMPCCWRASIILIYFSFPLNWVLGVSWIQLNGFLKWYCLSPLRTAKYLKKSSSQTSRRDNPLKHLANGLLGPIPKVSNWVGLGWGWIICFSNKFSGVANVASLVDFIWLLITPSLCS